LSAFLRILLLVPLLSLSACNGGGSISKEEARIRREVDQRVEVMRSEMKVSESRWKTARVVAFCLLAGGALIWLFNGPGSSSSGDSYPRLPDNRNHDPGYRRRVIDRPYDEDDEPYNDPRYR